MLRSLSVEEVNVLRREPVEQETLEKTEVIVRAVRDQGVEALRHYAETFGDIEVGGALTYPRDVLDEALSSLPEADRALLERCAERVRVFAQAQRDSIQEMELPIPGGRAGHRVIPMDRAGCYAPGGRFPLPSSVIMTAVTARVAGVKEVWVASPKPTTMTLAAAAVAGADGFLAVGGAQAIAALAYGAGDVPACEAIVGPGNRWVTAAKKIVSGLVAIDMLAGPSELLVVADDSAAPETIAADLLAQAEHDPDAIPILISLDATLPERVDVALEEQLRDLPTAETARAALQNGFSVAVSGLEEAISLTNSIGPEHLQLMFEDAESAMSSFTHFGGLFVGHVSAEVFGDYCAGPNHVLPTGGTARLSGGLSVMHFLKLHTWMIIDTLQDAQGLVDDAVNMARHEGLEGHARAALRRKK
ncbi:MAG: histidinol dehydrogenase [Deltaproteobacteria bacterium]|mgnify:CR=1 FL=1|nr:histidinol dehydrogenase [Deltaproteobacteria bacterium]|tara:strand:- start:2395 stop:3648 length:1254 start_codon:yes stop_codon:yes gene_type:complete